jgi:hypothetical protein
MECPGCERQLATLREIMFFCKAEKDIFFTMKPECSQTVQDRSLQVCERVGKKIKVNCKHCQFELGGQVPFGPNGTNLIAFGTEKVKVLGHSLTKKNKWWAEKDKEKFSSVTKRGPKDFFKGELGEEEDVPQFKAPASSPIVLPSRGHVEDFDWTNLLEDKTPRGYQVECFVEALRQNLIAVLPTGAGKTLIASMWLKRMKELNPEKMGLFVVDKIPLVKQQAKAIQADTGLRMLDIFGENKTLKRVNDL